MKEGEEPTLDELRLGKAVLAAAGLDGADAVLGPAEDGGWWVLGLRDPHAAVALRGVEMSTPRTYDDTLGALREVGLDVGIGETLRDIDDVDDAHAVATGLASELGGSDFARTWRRVAR